MIVEPIPISNELPGELSCQLSLLIVMRLYFIYSWWSDNNNSWRGFNTRGIVHHISYCFYTEAQE